MFANLFNGLIRAAYPPLCVSCGAETEAEQGLCANCWGDTYFIDGAICDSCGTPLIGEDMGDVLICDTCTHSPPPWIQGRASVVYDGGGRRIVLALKHGDRLDVVIPLGEWMIKSGAELLRKTDIIIPVPLHRSRLFSRKYNQSSALANQIAKRTNIQTVPDLLIRNKKTKMQKGMSRVERIENQSGAIEMNPRFTELIGDKNVLIIDDVMTTGATMSVCADTCISAGAATVNTLVFARVARDE
ncbi:amidophosphoribosyltransferase [Amylibacter ulvae]|uniref:Amidophosphoribosyltransferase n=2 Tax=Paramylibacter ulvae TaxID=1651968 RepID=A0ABQ3CY70_9RHOB|nr:amidophosphoribosyltransferase [Amylibacter ulvae]